MRSYGAAVRRIQREEERRVREAARRFKELQKIQEIEDARQAAEDYENYVYLLQNIHQEPTSTLDWDAISSQPQPSKPTYIPFYEKKAKQQLDNYKPSFLASIFGDVRRKYFVLNKAVEEAAKKDKQQHDKDLESFQVQLKKWESLREISLGVKKKEPESYFKALEYFDPFSEIAELGAKLHMSFHQNFVDVDLQVNGQQTIPDYELKQTSTGKLSKKSLAKSKFNELYQDHICSAILRISLEIFAFLPVQYVRVNAISRLLNPQTGHLEDCIILSVLIPLETLNLLNLGNIDPSDCMRNFNHSMNFSKVEGFRKVDKISYERIVN